MIKEEITKWSTKDFKEEVANKIAMANKPIEYTELVGFDKNGLWIYETAIINIEKVKELLTYFESYFITEQKDKIMIKRVN